MFCPMCQSEYRAGFTRCQECGVDLVSQLPEPDAELRARGFEVVFVTLNPIEADLVRSVLEASGIEVFMIDENITRIDPPIALMIGGMKVAVPQGQRDAAIEVLKQYRRTSGLESVPLEAVDTEGNDEYRCPRCRALLEVETTICPKCGHALFDGGNSPRADQRF